jgi:hypothetical protein
MVDHTHGGTGAAEGLEQKAHCSFDLLVRVEDDPPVVVIHEAQRRSDPQLSPARLVELSADEPRPEQM